jgi:hypothetical protein
MDDLRSILSTHHRKGISSDEVKDEPVKRDVASTSEIPDVFFDNILLHYKLNRIEICLLMDLYRGCWCKPNLHKKYGIGPFVSHAELASKYDLTLDGLSKSLRVLEDFGFIETIRAGQYFVRKYFTEELDLYYGQTYDNFL